MDLEVRRTELRATRIVDAPPPAPAEGQVLLHIDHAALTANNITYGAFGDVMGYWNFFPTEDGWGRIPVWGFADVEASTVEGLRDGDRVYGYFPMSTHLLVEPTRVTPTGFVDGAAHRRPLPPVYNQYNLVSRAPVDDDHRHAVLRPLFTTSFLIDDWLATQDCFGATSVIVASASSKTAIALAESLAARGGIEVIGLTSARNRDFVAGLGFYDRTVVYGEVAATLDPAVPSVLVDMGGDPAVRSEVHEHFAGTLRHSCSVGATHWEDVSFGGPPVPGPQPTLFFAPDQVQKRVADWGGAGFDERVGAAWDRFAASARAWLSIVEHRGPDAVTAAYVEVLEGRVAPSEAYVISLDA